VEALTRSNLASEESRDPKGFLHYFKSVAQTEMDFWFFNHVDGEENLRILTTYAK
jgi:hypothetical protein